MSLAMSTAARAETPRPEGAQRALTRVRRRTRVFYARLQKRGMASLGNRGCSLGRSPGRDSHSWCRPERGKSMRTPG
jgi:hypothetical protein